MNTVKQLSMTTMACRNARFNHCDHDRTPGGRQVAQWRKRPMHKTSQNGVWIWVWICPWICLWIFSRGRGFACGFSAVPGPPYFSGKSTVPPFFVKAAEVSYKTAVAKIDAQIAAQIGGPPRKIVAQIAGQIDGEIDAPKTWSWHPSCGPVPTHPASTCIDAFGALQSRYLVSPPGPKPCPGPGNLLPGTEELSARPITTNMKPPATAAKAPTSPHTKA